jgi:hypothetical protein
VISGDALFVAGVTISEGARVSISKDLTIVGVPGSVIDYNTNPSRETILVNAGHTVKLQGLTVKNEKANPAVNAQGNVTIVASTIGPSTAVGVQSVAGTTVVVERTLVTGCKGGLSLGGAYTVENSAIVGNIGAAAGVVLSQSGQFDFNTVTNNGDATHAGVQCNTSTAITSSIVFGNRGAQVSGACNASTSDTTIDPKFDTTTPGSNGFHLQATSPELDQVTCPAGGVPALDFDGDARPIGGACDVGADERP